MFTIFEGCKALRLEMVGIYWTLLTPVVLMAMIFEFFKRSLDFGEILKRIVVSIFLLWSFEYVVHVVAMIADGITVKMDGENKMALVVEHLQKNFTAEFPSMMQFRQMLLFVVSFICYVVAILSFYLTDIISNFVYMVLYVVSPLGFLCFIPTSTQNIAKNIYRGIINVAVWRVLWSIMANFLFEVVRSPMNDWGNFLMGALINLCVGISMLLIPFFTRSLLSDGLAGVSSTVMATATMPVAQGIKRFPISPGRFFKKRSAKNEKNK